MSKEKNSLSVPYYKLFKFSTALEKFLIFLGVATSIVSGAAAAVVFLLYGKIAGVIVDYAYAAETHGNNPKIMEEANGVLWSKMHYYVAVMSSLATSILVATFIATMLLNFTALRQIFRIRKLFFAKVLNQDISWYDQNQTGDFASRMVDDLKKIEDGIGEKLGMVIFCNSMCVTSFIQCMVKGWELTLICLISIVVLVISMSVVSWVSSKFTKKEGEAYGAAGAMAEEVLSSIKTVIAFGGQEKEQARYDRFLESAKKSNIRRSIFSGIGGGLNWFTFYCNFSLSLWYGVRLILRERELPADQMTYDAGTMLMIIVSILTAQFYYTQSMFYTEILGVSQGAAVKIFEIISSEPTINRSKNQGHKFKNMAGKIIFGNVHFNYPSRKEVEVLRNFNLTINPGETVALVGASGCGKSTCIQLIQRFYDPDAGFVSIDGHKLEDLNLEWLRSSIGVVGQEPVLFETTIEENIKMGNLGATEAEVEMAARKANAHAFICTLPHGYSTLIGERGTQLSGGQKQRIAIARALVRKPTILLLDEATSALDTKNETIVQAALDTASHSCTTVVVAHRLSTVRKANRIVVIEDGQVAEEGSHDELVAAEGAYFRLIATQLSEESDLHSEAFSNTKVDSHKDKHPKEKVFGHLQIEMTEKELPGTKFTNTTSTLWAIMKYNAPERWIILIGCLCCIVNGAGIPVYSLMFGDVIGVLAGEDPIKVQRQANLYCMGLLIIGIVTAIAIGFQYYTLGVSGEHLTMRLRSLMFKSILRQEMGWFDKKENGVGCLLAKLSGEPESVQGATGQKIGAFLNTGSTIIIAITISFVYEWRITFISLCFSPLIAVFVYLEHKILASESFVYYDALKNSTRIAVEAISGIRTVASLGCEKVFQDMYITELLPYLKTAKKNTIFRGFVYGMSRSILWFAYPGAFYYGAILVQNEGLNPGYVIVVAEGLIFGALTLSNALAFTPNISRGVIGAHKIMELINGRSKIMDGCYDLKERWEAGNLKYENVFFSYPSRPSVEVLTNFDLSILKDKMVALVGPSGCGKSTVVQLLERFYDPTSGKITADGKEIKRMSLRALRSHLGMVSQEPVLFSQTIGKNIAYGDNTRKVTEEEIIDAAKQANIHNFVVSLPLGYDTRLGEKGTQLSGGQKQRIAIARALVRKPKVLILDEATSALDAESEKVVQMALDNAKVGRTCITIAHRLTTIQDADAICVMSQGRISEIGTHLELMEKKGLYYGLQRSNHIK